MTSTEYTRNYLGRWTQAPRLYDTVSTSNSGTYGSTEWFAPRGSSKSNLETALKYIYKVHGEYEQEQTYYKPAARKPVRPSLPESYPKGDLNDLFGVDSEE